MTQNSKSTENQPSNTQHVTFNRFGWTLTDYLLIRHQFRDLLTRVQRRRAGRAIGEVPSSVCSWQFERGTLLEPNNYIIITSWLKKNIQLDHLELFVGAGDSPSSGRESNSVAQKNSKLKKIIIPFHLQEHGFRSAVLNGCFQRSFRMRRSERIADHAFAASRVVLPSFETPVFDADFVSGRRPSSLSGSYDVRYAVD